MAAGRLSRRRAHVLRRRVAVLGIVALVVVLGYLLWLRDSSLFSVDEVTVEGVTADREQVTAALEQAAEGMTTLHVREDELRDAASQFPTVATVSADADFPHGLRIEVSERLPVAVGKVDGQPVAISAEGYVLQGVSFDATQLPSLTAGPVSGAHLGSEGTAQAQILGATPDELRERLRAASWDTERGGVVVDLEGAPELRFGGGDRAEAKWEAVAAVLSEPDVGSPSYVDVSVPERPVVG